MKATIDAPDVDTYIASLPDERRQIVAAVHKALLEAVPDLEVKMWKQFIGYGSYHYKYASGREGDWPPIAMANQKNYVSVYVCAVENGQYLAEANLDRLGKVSVGRSCIRFKKLEDINLDVLQEISKRAAALVKSGQFAM